MKKVNHLIRWEVRYTSVESGKTKVHSRETRELARRLQRTMKRHPDVATNVKMYRVSEYFDNQGNPAMTFHKRTR